MRSFFRLHTHLQALWCVALAPSVGHHDDAFLVVKHEPHLKRANRHASWNVGDGGGRCLFEGEDDHMDMGLCKPLTPYPRPNSCTNIAIKENEKIRKTKTYTKNKAIKTKKNKATKTLTKWKTTKTTKIKTTKNGSPGIRTVSRRGVCPWHLASP